MVQRWWSVIFCLGLCWATTWTSGSRPAVDPNRFFDACVAARDDHLTMTPPPDTVDHLDPRRIFNHLDQNREAVDRCTRYSCMVSNLDADPRLLASMACHKTSDCRPDVSGMVCRPFAGDVRYCDCPRGQAYNATSCSCQEARMCQSAKEFCHNGLKCADRRCFCDDLGLKLYEPHGGVCVLPEHRFDRFGYYLAPSPAYKSSSSGDVVAAAVLGAFLFVLLTGLAIYAYHYYSGSVWPCQRGDYECEQDLRSRSLRGKNPSQSNQANRSRMPKMPSGAMPGFAKARFPVLGRSQGRDNRGVSNGTHGHKGQRYRQDEQVHVAAWDLPSLDYLDEEQTVKYVHRSHDSHDGVPDIQATDIEPEICYELQRTDPYEESCSSVGSGRRAESLPECEQANVPSEVVGNRRSQSYDHLAGSNSIFSNPNPDQHFDRVTQSSGLL